MDRITQIIDIATAGRPTTGLILVALLLLLFGIELRYWLGRYARIPRYRNPRREVHPPIDGISIVVLLGDDYFYLENTLPKLMGQQYPDFEVVIVEVSSTPEFSDELELHKARYPNLATARLDPDPRFRISDKMIYNIGIKTARYSNIILTTPDASPVSAKWLDCMAKGFENGDVVIGYCGLEPHKGFINKMLRCSRLMFSIRYLSSAIAGRPYRGILQNLGFTKKIYFANRGFNHLDMTIGEDDLFIQKIATRENTSIVMNPHATVRQDWRGGTSGWWRRRRINGTARRFYPAAARRATSIELFVRFFFLLTVIAFAVLMPLYTAFGALGVWIIRLFIVRHKTSLICRRLGEKGLSGTMLIYDLIEPFTSIFISISRRIRPMKEVWNNAV